jgi:hypothetical protein
MDDGDAQGLNQLVRLRTAGGHQITMHDTSGFIYIINKSGTAWLEMDRAGNINIYAAGQFNVAATGGIQLQSAGSVKIQGKKGVDISSDNNVNIGGAGGVNLASTKGAVKISAKTDLHLKGVKSHLEGSSCVSIKGGAHVDIVGGCITLNTGGASPAQQASTAAAPTGMPTKEPWTGHLKGNSGSGNSLNPSATGSQSAGTGPGGAYSSSTNYSGVPSQADVINAASTTVNRGENVQGGATVTTLSQNANGVNPVSSYVAYPDLIGKGVTLPGVNGTQCVALVQANSNLGNTSNWYPANNRSLFDNPPPQGTCIATFGASGNYTNTPGQSHAAIYLDQGQDQNGRFIVVQDQWVGSNGTQVRKIYEGGGAESAQNFRAIATQNNPSGVQVSGAPPVRQTDDNPPTQEGTTPRNNDTSVRPDTNTNSKTAVSPEDEAKLRAQQKQISEDSSAGSLDYGPPLIKDPGASASSAASTGSGQVTNNDQIVVPNVSVNQSAISVYSSIRDNAQNRVNTAQQNLDDLTIKKNSGLIDQATYDQQASKFQSQIDANQRTVDSAQNKINYSTQNVVEINKAQGFTNITSNSSVSGSGSGSLVISTSQTTYDPATGTWTTKTTGGPGLNAGGTNVGVGAPQYTDAQKQEINNLNGQQAQSLAIIQVNKNTIEHAQENIKDADQKLAAGEISIAERNDIVYKANADISAAQQTIGEETANLNQTTTKINEIDAAATQSNLVSGNDYQENAVAGLDYSDKLNTDSRGSVQDAENNTSQQIGYDETTGNTYTITNPDTSASRDLNYSAASTAAKDSPSGPQNVTNPDGAAVVQPNTDNSGDPFGGAAYANDVQQTNTGINRTVVNDQLSNVNSPYGDPPAIDTLSQQNTPSYRQSEIDSMQNYQSDQGPPAPITGNNNSPGSGGQGLPGAPQNNSPSSASGPTC